MKGSYNTSKRRAYICIDSVADQMNHTETDENGWEWELDYQGKRVGVFIPDLDLDVHGESSAESLGMESPQKGTRS